ncbi:neoverrucotoxin subunit alpha-like isoform X2 [Sebastes umbrosus]|uniref:neoverrucotoxin subunit alpha-like isoform X2 n=1 Tax=Sebastes umbrosus TaxID=72105 RepID=UPI00189CF74A|nr:neoverrucotoxin subunit alpha-like isoform X2 [Sebastes umbrosus]
MGGQLHQVGEMDSDLMAVAALGRPFTLGMLYDARKDALIPGLTLWDDATLQEKITENSQKSSDFESSTSDSIEFKSSLLDVNASLKASFLSGLIEIDGSAKYLNDHKKYMNQSRVTGRYKATTSFKQLSMVDLLTLNPHQTDVIEKGLATHVVTGILYGANAFFVFDSEKLEDSRVQDIQGSMKTVINKIPSFNVEAKVNTKLSDEEKSLTEKCFCKFFGDFILESNPTTYKDAVKTCTQLPKLLGEKGENAVPLKVWLMPLKNLYPKAAKLTCGISVAVVRKMQNALEGLMEMQMRCNDSLEDTVVEDFPMIREELNTFQKLCSHYASHLQQNMAEKLPSIRDGEEDESSLRQLFEDRDKTPFSPDKLSKWLDQKEREINIIRSCVDAMEGTKIVLSQSELDREALAPGVEHTVCFVFTSMARGDTYLDGMADYLDSHKLGSTNEGQWYSSPKVVTKMREKAKAFHELSKAQKNNKRLRFLIAAITNEKYKGATIYHYKDGNLVSEDFSKPDVPPGLITDKRDLIWYACDLTLDPNTANGYLTLSEGNKKATVAEWQYYPYHPERFEKQTQVLCKEGLSGLHYWEVEWNDFVIKSVYAAVAYSRIGRKGKGYDSSFGNNTISWAVGQEGDTGRIWHNGLVKSYPGGCTRVGVYLDWPAGNLSFYSVLSNTLEHLHTFHTTFTQPVYPGIWAYKTGNSAYLRPV